MASLQFVSSDVLCVVTAYLSVWDIGRLWFCGSRMLCLVMAHGGVTEFRWEMKAFDFADCFPLLALQFSRLELLSIESHTLMPLNDISAFLNALPPSLTSLSLKGSPFTSNLDSWLVSNYRDRLPRLKSLRLPFYGANPIFDLTHLPLELINLRLLVKDQKTDLTQLSLLPLTTLSLNSSRSISGVWIPAIPTLQKLSLRSYTSPDLSLLPNLRHFTCYSQIGSESLLYLPSQLESLAVGLIAITETTMQSLPRSLTSLILFETEDDIELEVEDIQALPPNLKRFVAHAAILAENSESFLPPSLLELECFLAACDTSMYDLTTFTVDDDFIVDAKGRKLHRIKFPPSLTSYRASREFDTLDHALMVLPPTLTLLEGGAFLWRPDSVPLPPALQTLCCELPSWKDEDNAHSSQSCDGGALKVPPTLTDLNIRNMAPAPLTTFLSPSLTSLRMHIPGLDATPKISACLSAGWSKLLPTTLKHLWLGVPAAYIDNDWFEHLNTPHLLALSIVQVLVMECDILYRLERLPSGLTRLKLSSPLAIDWKAMNLKCLLNLSKLTLLSSKGSISLPGNLVTLLPNRLTTLNSVAMLNEKPGAIVLRELRKAKITFRFATS